jgi:predicted nucleic acid-binding protein
MIDLDEQSFISAARDNLVANTPLFLLKKLRQDSSVIALSKRHSASEILAALQITLRRSDLPRNSVQPHILLVALSLKKDRKFLNLALSLEASQFRWYKDIATALLQKMVAETNSTITVPNFQITGSNLERVSNSIINLEVVS